MDFVVFKEVYKERIEKLLKLSEEFKEKNSKEVERLSLGFKTNLAKQVIKQIGPLYFDLVGEVMLPFFGIKYSDSEGEFSVGKTKLRTDESGRIYKIIFHPWKDDNEKDVFELEIKDNSIKFKMRDTWLRKNAKLEDGEKFMGVDEYLEVFLKTDKQFKKYKNLTKAWLENVDEFYKDFKTYGERLVEEERKLYENFKSSLKSLEQASEKFKDLKLGAGRLVEPVFLFSLSDVLDYGLLDKVDYSGLERDVIPLFISRDRRVPIIVKHFEDEPENFLSLKKVLEAEARRELPKIVALGDKVEALNYYRKCDLPLDEFKKQAIEDIKNKFGQDTEKLDEICGQYGFKEDEFKNQLMEKIKAKLNKELREIKKI